MEFIYIATSTQFPGMVKIGRTDRDVETRMDELSNDDYGVEGFSGSSEWEATHFFRVEDNEVAERLIHEQFGDLRVSDNRELFYSDDPASIAEQAAEISGGTLFGPDTDPEKMEALFDDFEDNEFDILESLSETLEDSLPAVFLGYVGIELFEMLKSKFSALASIPKNESSLKHENRMPEQKPSSSATFRKLTLDKIEITCSFCGEVSEHEDSHIFSCPRCHRTLWN